MDLFKLVRSAVCRMELTYPHLALFGPSLPASADNFQDFVFNGAVQLKELPGVGAALWPAATHAGPGTHADYVAFLHREGAVLCGGSDLPCK